MLGLSTEPHEDHQRSTPQFETVIWLSIPYRLYAKACEKEDKSETDSAYPVHH